MEQTKSNLRKFATLAWYDGLIEFLFKFAAKTSELLLAAGLIVSAADFLTDGHVVQGNAILSGTWAWTQAIAIESSAGVVLVYGLESRDQYDYVKTGAYAILGTLLAVVAGIMLYIQIAAHSLALTEAAATLRLGINPQIMALLRSIVCIGFIVLSRTKAITFSNFKKQPEPAREESAPAISYDQLAEHIIPRLTPVLASLTRTIITEHYQAALSTITTTQPAALPEPTEKLTGTAVAEEQEPETGTGTDTGTRDSNREPEKVTTREAGGSNEKLHAAYEAMRHERTSITGETLRKRAGVRKQTALIWMKEHSIQESAA